MPFFRRTAKYWRIKKISDILLSLLSSKLYSFLFKLAKIDADVDFFYSVKVAMRWFWKASVRKHKEEEMTRLFAALSRFSSSFKSTFCSYLWSSERERLGAGPNHRLYKKRSKCTSGVVFCRIHSQTVKYFEKSSKLPEFCHSGTTVVIAVSLETH